MQRRVSPVVQTIDINAILYQETNDLLMPVLSRPMERRPAHIVYNVEIAAASDELRGNGVEPAFARQAGRSGSQ